MSLGVHHIPGVIPATVVEAALVLTEKAVRVEREGAGPGSLTDEGLRYSVVDGLQIEEHAPYLSQWIREVIPAYASALVGEALRVSPDVRTAINVNLVEGVGGMYELHTDPCPWSALIFCSGSHTGGEWEAAPYGMGGDVTLSVAPRAGSLLVFRGDIPHAVRPLRLPERRVSIPVALYPQGTDRIERDPALDAHIFGEEQ